MDSYQMPYYLFYCANQPYYNFNSYAYIYLLAHNSLQFEPSQEMEKQIKTTDYPQESNKEYKSQNSSKLARKDSQKRKENKIQLIRNREKDVQFKQRQQTANRNLCSNTWKVYLKQLRDKNAQTYLGLYKIIQANQIDITVEQFMSKINSYFPTSATYISFDNVKKICNQIGDSEYDFNFAKVFRISIARFYSYEIFAVNIKSIRTTRKIRNQQIKQGKIFLRQLFL